MQLIIAPATPNLKTSFLLWIVLLARYPKDKLKPQPTNILFLLKYIKFPMLLIPIFVADTERFFPTF